MPQCESAGQIRTLSIPVTDKRNMAKLLKKKLPSQRCQGCIDTDCSAEKWRESAREKAEKTPTASPASLR